MPTEDPYPVGILPVTLYADILTHSATRVLYTNELMLQGDSSATFFIFKNTSLTTFFVNIPVVFILFISCIEFLPVDSGDSFSHSS